MIEQTVVNDIWKLDNASISICQGSFVEVHMVDNWEKELKVEWKLKSQSTVTWSHNLSGFLSAVVNQSLLSLQNQNLAPASRVPKMIQLRWFD